MLVVVVSTVDDVVSHAVVDVVVSAEVVVLSVDLHIYMMRHRIQG